jgi:hypothetical protein
MRNRIFSLFVLAAAACGGAAAQAPVPAASAPAPQGGPGANGAATFGDESFKGPMKPLAPTAMADDLKALGLDPNALPALGELPPDKLRAVMKTFAKALGAHCTDCHVGGDFAAPTPRKAIASGMWTHFVRERSTADGGPVYCDSCHQGTMTPLLDRHDDKALSHWMADNFVAKLKLRSGQKNDCTSCHGEPFEGHFMKKWAESGPAVPAK